MVTDLSLRYVSNTGQMCQRSRTAIVETTQCDPLAAYLQDGLSVLHDNLHHEIVSLIARLMGPTWGPSGTGRSQVGPILAPWFLLSGMDTIKFLAIVQNLARLLYYNFLQPNETLDRPIVYCTLRDSAQFLERWHLNKQANGTETETILLVKVKSMKGKSNYK